MRLFATTAAIALFSAGAALAAIDVDALVGSLQGQGYSRVEVKNGPTQTKVEAIRGTEKVEVVYDKATGAVLKSETDAVQPGDDIAPGVSVRDRDRDFVDGGQSDDDESDDLDASDDSDDSNDSSDDSNDDSDDGDDHDSNDDHDSSDGGDSDSDGGDSDSDGGDDD